MKKFLSICFLFLMSAMASQANDLRFVQVTDVRYNSAEDNGTFAKTIQDINKQKDVKFVVFTGDNINKPDKNDLSAFLKEAKKLKLVESVEEENRLFIEEVADVFGAKVEKGWYGTGFIVPNTDYATCFVDGVVLDPIYSGKLMCFIGKGSPMSVRAKSIGNFAVSGNTDKVVSEIKSYIESEAAHAAAVKRNYQAIINSVSDLRDVKYTMEITPNTTLIMIAKNGYYGNVVDAINDLNQYEDRITTSHGDFGEYFEDSYEDLNPKYRDLEVVAITYKD